VCPEEILHALNPVRQVSDHLELLGLH
jgi:hypothetical protein